MVDRDSGRTFVENSSDEGGSEIRLSDPNRRISRGKNISLLMVDRDSGRTFVENSSDEGGSEIRLSDPNSLDPSMTHIHHERLELENSHEVLRRLVLCAKSDIIIPKKGDMCHEPPSGYFTTYLDHFSNGFSLPPNALLVEIVRSLGVSFSQLTPNAIVAFACFHRRMSEIRIPVTLDLFHALFSARCTGPDRGWGVPTTWSSGLSKIKIGGTHHALQLECGSLGLFDETIDPGLLLPLGKKIDLAEVRALQNGAGRRPVKAPWVRLPRRRVEPDSRDAPRRMGSPRSTDRRNSHQSRQRPVADGKSTSDRRKELGPKSGAVPRQSGEDGAQKNLKRSREVENGASHNASGGGHLFVEGVNRRDRAGSFWDMSDPDLGWSMGKTLIGDHDVLHLLPQPTESLTHALAWNACQVLSLASTFQLREERSRNSESKLHEEIAMLREELLKKQKESEKYSLELTTGEHFLDSAEGKTLLTSTGEIAVEGYRASSAFRDEVLQQALTIHDQVVIDCRRQLRETKLVSEDIVRMIEPSVPEPGDENHEELLGTLDEILGDIDDDEMIEALRQNPI
ncbi:hypothetical protein F511_11019 [Dorcoceras hygrometricum]|uniref:Transposase (putative) gypsy type domain-containing protein n=1 Tax=Dorcoceras hygrometricum TaxID=472368 RepID=A0A2Z7CQM7_9LAMI|nr:hypothetical protein F511_11019 [Dorcoceras hygrometricum]